VTKTSKILVPLDGSQHSKRGLSYAVFLARHSDGVVTGVHVIPMVKPKPNDRITPLEKAFLKKAGSIMGSARRACAKQGVMFEDRLLYGDEGPEIAKLAERGGFDVVVIGSRGRGRAKEILLGGTSNHVLHKTSVPVMVVK